MRRKISFIVSILVLAVVLGTLLVTSRGGAVAQGPGGADGTVQLAEPEMIDAGPPGYLALEDGEASDAPGADPSDGRVRSAALSDEGFTYQGRLTDGGRPAEGTYDLRFILYDAEVGGTQIGTTITHEDVSVSDGLFMVILDFGAGAFPGAARYLEIGVRPSESADDFTVLSPRQEVTPTPYAIYAGDADRLDGFDSTYFSSIYHDHDDRYLRRRIGTQFTGEVEAGQTKQWYTFGWPTDEVIHWSVHPTTDQGRLEWSVEVRLSGSGFTYYITVTNTGSTDTYLEAKYVRFE